MVQDAIVTDEDGEFPDNYVKYKVDSKEDLRDIYKDGKDLVRLAEPADVIVNFYEIKNGEKYQVHKYFQIFQGWQKKEADAKEAETLLAMKSYLAEKLLATPVDLPTDFHDSNGRKIQEWDGALLSADTLYLLEAKHSMSEEKVKNIAARVEAFPNVVKKSKYEHLAGSSQRLCRLWHILPQ